MTKTNKKCVCLLACLFVNLFICFEMNSSFLHFQIRLLSSLYFLLLTIPSSNITVWSVQVIGRARRVRPPCVAVPPAGQQAAKHWTSINTMPQGCCRSDTCNPPHMRGHYHHETYSLFVGPAANLLLSSVWLIVHCAGPLSTHRGDSTVNHDACVCFVC